MAARWVRNRYAEAIDKKNVPERGQPRRQPQDDQLRPEAHVHAAVAVGRDRASATTSRRPAASSTSVKDLFDPKFKGRVTFLSEPYDSADLVLIGDGVDASKATIDQILGAIEKIGKANDSGQIRRFTGNDYTTDLTKGNVWVSVAYSGDLIQLQSDNPDLRFVYPEEGAVLFTDNMMMPAKVEHPYAAETMMNYVYEPAGGGAGSRRT